LDQPPLEVLVFLADHTLLLRDKLLGLINQELLLGLYPQGFIQYVLSVLAPAAAATDIRHMHAAAQVGTWYGETIFQ
jgi:hypothetical protein